MINLRWPLLAVALGGYFPEKFLHSPTGRLHIGNDLAIPRPRHPDTTMLIQLEVEIVLRSRLADAYLETRAPLEGVRAHRDIGRRLKQACIVQFASKPHRGVT